MARYIQFSTADGSTILVEVEEQEVSTEEGVMKAGLMEAANRAIAVAQDTFEAALEQLVQHNVQPFIQAVRSLSDPPEEIQVNFSLKATGEVGNLAIAKGGGEANYSIRLVWKRQTSSE